MASGDEFVEELKRLVGEEKAARIIAELGGATRVSRTPAKELAARFGLTHKEARAVVSAAARAVVRFKTAAAALEDERSRKRLRFGVNVVDRAIGGGFPEGSVVLVYGRPGAGKSQMAFHLSALVAGGWGDVVGRVFYVDTEGTFSAERILQIADARGLNVEAVKERVVVMRAESVAQLQAALEAIREEAERSGDVKLVVVDSLLNPFRKEFRGLSELSERQGELAKTLRIVGDIAASRSRPVVFLTTHVVANISTTRREYLLGGFVLGHAPDPVIYLRRGAGERRILKIDDSASLPSAEAVFRIAREGIVE